MSSERLGLPTELILAPLFAAPASSALPPRVEETEEEQPLAETTSAVDPRQLHEVAGAIPAAAGGTTELIPPPPAFKAEPGAQEKEKAGGEPEPLAGPVARNVEERKALRGKKWQANLGEVEPEAEEDQPAARLGADNPVHPEARRRKPAVPADEDEDLEVEQEQVVARPPPRRKVEEVGEEDVDIDFGAHDDE